MKTLRTIEARWAIAIQRSGNQPVLFLSLLVGNQDKTPLMEEYNVALPGDGVVSLIRTLVGATAEMLRKERSEVEQLSESFEEMIGDLMGEFIARGRVEDLQELHKTIGRLIDEKMVLTPPSAPEPATPDSPSTETDPEKNPPGDQEEGEAAAE